MTDSQQFDLGLAQRFVLQRVFELGWTEERFGEFDRFVNRYTNDYRSAHKAERIGKKYQWLAWHEFLARVSDNFEFRGDRWLDDEQQYEGPWQIGARDIDPSCTLTGTGRNDWGATPRCWWSPVDYDGFAQGPFGLAWVNEHSDLPEVPPLLEMVHPRDGSKWLALQTYSGWEEEYDREDHDRYALPRRDIWYAANAYIVRAEDADAFWEWATRQDFSGRWMPEAGDSYKVFLGEFPWAPAYLSQVSARGVGAGWLPANSDRIPVDTLIPAERYLAEGGSFDCSLGDGLSLMLPVKWLADAMRLRWGGRDSAFSDANGRCVSLDPSYSEAGPQALLIQREAFEDLLKRSDCEVFWTVLGEKRLIPGGGASGCLGWMTVWGAYRQRGGRVEGSLRHSVTISSREGDGD